MVRLSSLKIPMSDELLDLVALEPDWIVSNYLCHGETSSFGGECFISIPSGVEYQPHDEMIEIPESEYLAIEAESKAESKAKNTPMARLRRWFAP